MIKKLYVKVPLIEFLSRMSNYVKFLNEIHFKKRRLEEHEMVAMTTTTSAVIQSMQPKLKDLGSFSIP